jgi:hypothetical protein
MPQTPELAPWLALAGLGAFHGVNPAMGWLFAVALGLHRNSRALVWQAVLPIAVGHALSIAAVVGAIILAGVIVDHRSIAFWGGIGLIAWAIYHAIYGHRGRVRIGMRTGMLGLALWSFLMATGHGAGLMLVPVILPLCIAQSPASDLIAAGSVSISLAAVGVHTVAMLVVTTTIAVLVYEWVGVGILRKGWINLDWIWAGALIGAGLLLLLQAT